MQFRLLLPMLLAAACARGAEPSFERDVQPLLNAKCVKCHSEKSRKADLDLSSADGLAKGGESGPVFVAGKPEKSSLYEKVHSGEMPPKKADRLSELEVETLKKWIEAGAKMTVAAKAEPISQHDVYPILLRRCTVCHGRNRQEGGLDLRTRASILRGGKSGSAINVEKPDESKLLKKIADGSMPPRDRLVEASIKPIESPETETIRKWIAAGAPELDIQPDVATTAPDELVTDKDRDFWAFRSPKPQTVPEVKAKERVRNPIDAFILSKLEAKGMSLSPEADRATLIRRASFDLTGLPPAPSDLEAFLADTSADAYEKMIDRLLASPRYGERWGRRWLDLAGYADSEGKREQDLPRAHAWRYRDYVIQAFNKDKPHDRFLMEQLAGDELADYEKAPEITKEIYDNLVATGFLRMAPDASWANITGYLPDRLEVVSDEIDVVGSAIMGLSIKCAKCHTHKFDPFPHRDYYRLAAIFKGALDEHDWLKPEIRPGIGPVSMDFVGGRTLKFVTTAERQEWERTKKGVEPRIQALWDRGEPTPTYIYRRGEPNTPGRLVGPGVPSMLTDGKTPFIVQPPWPGAKSTGRRLAFAKWITQPDHPLTWRVEVNRMWKHHFGQGIVKTLGNFGKVGAPPTHPELLDWLAREFVASGMSRKAMHRLMLTSSTYRQRSGGEANPLDPDNSLLSRMPFQRLDAEALYDTLLLASGRLDEKPGGPADAVTVRADGLVTPTQSGVGFRRLIYVKQARKQLATHLETFDFPQMNPNCIERRDSTVAPQALYLMNNETVEQLADAFAARVKREAGDDLEAQVRRVYLIAASREPTERERTASVEVLKRLRTEWAASKIQDVNRKALANFCHAVVNSAAFVYVD